MTGLPYDDSVEEALCYGWIDSLVKRLDDERYLRKFTPRKPDSVWSESNKARARKMMSAGLMTSIGRALIDHARRSGAWQRTAEPPGRPSTRMPSELRDALDVNPRAEQGFRALTPSRRKQYTTWVGAAKRAETRVRRAREAISRLATGKPLGLK